MHAHWPEFIRTSSVAAPDVTLTVTADPSMKDAWSATTPSELSVRRIEEREDREDRGDAWLVERADFSGQWSPESRKAQVRYAGDLPFLSSFLRVLSCAVLSRKGGALIHASCVRTARGAVLFPGPSGTGKSTVAGLAPEGTVLSDEVTAVQLVDGRLIASPTPFWGDLRRIRAAEAAPLRAVVLIDRSAPPPEAPPKLSPSTCTCVPALPASALATLMHCAFAFDGGAVDKEGILFIMREIVRSSPLYRLHYAPPEDPWPLLERLLPPSETDVAFDR